MRKTDPGKQSLQGGHNNKYEGKSIVQRVLFIFFLVLFLLTAGFGAGFYWWTTHAVFEYRLQPVVILDGQSVNASDFLYPSEDTENISADYLNLGFRPTDGLQTVTLVLTKNWRTIETDAVLCVLTPIKQIHHEFAASGPALDPIDLISNAYAAFDVSFDIHFTEETMPLEEYPVGEFALQLSLNGTPFTVMLYVTDNTPPTATPVNKTIMIGEEVSPEDFVTDVFDASPIESIVFVNEPDVLAHHDQFVDILIEDAFGNRDIFTAMLYIELNTSPPVIEGTKTIESLVGNPIIYRQDVTAYDDFGRELEVQIDSSSVDQYVEAMYTVYYWAEDLTGLRTEIEVTVHVINIDPEYVNERVDATLAEILRDGMTQVEQAQAINNWIRGYMTSSGTIGGPQSVYELAYRALRDRRGNCFNRFALAELLLSRAGIPSMRIDRVPGPGLNHRWNLINPDELGWHHFDASSPNTEINSRLYMFTASQAVEFSQIIARAGGTQYFYEYNPELYPSIVR
ncbi:MAG: transglutaminase domain-containing protein [Oscillospiraceae bacterium]|jgi:transglutaminase-like putative cysteine protease|nr:transglutaminase domain-containing protein [Oscillospiraceae bacterium]